VREPTAVRRLLAGRWALSRSGWRARSPCRRI